MSKLVRLLQLRRRAPTRPILATAIAWIFCWGVTRLAMSIVYRMRCRGAEHVLRRGPMIYISNHQSHFDPPIVGSLVYDRPFTAIARSTLFRFKPFAWTIKLIGAIPLEMGTSDRAAMRTAIEELKDGGCVLLFPEGSRTRDGAMGEFKNGVYMLLKRSGAPVLPVAFEGAYDIWPHGQRFPKLRGRILVETAAPPIPAQELTALGPEKALEHLRRIIETKRLELRKELRAKTRGRYPAPGPADEPYWAHSPAARE